MRSGAQAASSQGGVSQRNQSDTERTYCRTPFAGSLKRGNSHEAEKSPGSRYVHKIFILMYVTPPLKNTKKP